MHAIYPKCVWTYLLLATIASGATPSPKALSANLLRNAVEIAPSAAEENHLRYESDANGNFLLIARIRSLAAYSRLFFQNVRLPHDSTLLVYGVDAQDQITSEIRVYPPASTSGEFWTKAIPGTSVIVELQLGASIPGDVPFQITQMAGASGPDTPDAEAEQPAPSSAATRTATYRGREINYVVENGKAIFEGDIILGEADEFERSSKANTNQAVAISGEGYRWPNGIIPYYLPESLSNGAQITRAIDHWNTQLAGVIRLVPRTNQASYVYFVDTSRCASAVGKSSSGAQYIEVDASCSTGNIIHEIGHAVGLWHEHSREDRNRHVQILWQNLTYNGYFNFGQNVSNGTDVGAYDFGSIMHYHATAFSSNGQPTIQTIPPGIPIGQRSALSPGDIAAVRQLYANEQTEAPRVPVETTPVTISANASGVSIVVDGVSYLTPRTFQWVTGSRHSVSAPQTISGLSLLTFLGWTSGGAKDQMVVASSARPLITANYAQSHQLSLSVYPPGAGTVTSTPGPGYLPLHTNVSLLATPAYGYCFTSWTNLTSGTPAMTSITMSKPYALQANFSVGAGSLSSGYTQAAADGGTYTIGVNASGGCPWTSSSYAPWISISQGRSGSGSGVVQFTVEPNPYKFYRISVVYVAGQIHVVGQQGNN